MLHVDSNPQSPPIANTTPPLTTEPPTATPPSLLKAPPILQLFPDLSSDKELDESEEDPGGHGYLVLAVPESVTVPYNLSIKKNHHPSPYS